jgi:hypothetical protein
MDRRGGGYMHKIEVTVYSYRLRITKVWHDEVGPDIPEGAVVITQISKSVRPEDDLCEIIKEINQEIKDTLTTRGLGQ